MGLADEETRPLDAPVTATVDEFSTTLQRDLDSRRSLIQSSARTSVGDARLDLGLRGLFSATLHLVGQNRKRPEFTTLFDTHIGAVVRHTLKRQARSLAICTTSSRSPSIRGRGVLPQDSRGRPLR